MDYFCQHCGHISTEQTDCCDYSKLQMEVVELRAFKEACEKQEAVAYQWEDPVFKKQFGENPPGEFALHYFNLRPLYSNPDPEAAQLRMRIDNLMKVITEQDYEYNRKTNALIKRHAEKVAELEAQLAERDQQVADACAVTCEKSDRYRGDYFAHKLRSGEWRKHMKGGES